MSLYILSELKFFVLCPLLDSLSVSNFISIFCQYMRYRKIFTFDIPIEFLYLLFTFLAKDKHKVVTFLGIIVKLKKI